MLLPLQVLQSIEAVEQEFYDLSCSISHSYKTVQTYKTSINKLRKFLKEKHQFDELTLKSKIENTELDIYQFLRTFVIYLDKNGVKDKGVRTYLSGVKGYLRHLGIRINSDDLKQFIRLP